jgi:cyclopropane-fatty-acyl-phospholipid synthase
MILLSIFLRHLVRIGTLIVIDASGRTHTFAGSPSPRITIRFHDHWLPLRLFLTPSMACGEGYTDGRLTVEGATLYDFMDLVGRNMEAAHTSQLRPLLRHLQRLFRPFQQFNPIRRSRRNVAHHYDLSGALYELFLDKDRQYSCAYFVKPDDSLEEAQEQKKRHIASKLLIEPGQRVLDIGCGWGGLGLHLARETGADVTGVTLSEEQLKVAQDRAANEGLSGAQFHLRDYREQTGQFDRIVSVGMFEHVGVTHYETYFRKVHDLLKDDGIVLLHSIGRTDGPGVTDPWIRKYIFPGGYIPALSEVATAIERCGLCITDVEVLRLHYAETLRQWRMRFLANRSRVAALYDERFCRMWEFYLVGSEISFRYLNTVVFQIQMAKRQEAVPLTRDYITDTDRSRPGTRDESRRRFA